MVNDEAGVDAYLSATGDAFEIPVEDRERFRGMPTAVLAGDIPGWCLVGWMDGDPVATAVICIATGVAGLSNIATVARHRRRGIGAAVTAHGLRLARERGYRTAVCTSTAEGEPLYLALGFVERCRVDDFEFRPPG
jgi:ribosomal protein S18 acetylase RimI-like enzyme